MSRSISRPRTSLAITGALLSLELLMASTAVADTGSSTTYQEPYRPQFHFTPAQNWMNDPNGLVYYQGRYHLFFQYNPAGDTWGNMSWGHAVSTDLVHWQELPLAIPQDDTEMVFSGSAVVDTGNTSGFGSTTNPPLVAVYTSQQKATGKEEQAVAFSTDGGTTWTKYGPVLDIGSQNFRDPKVFWDAGSHRWLMTVALAADHRVQFYASPDLKHWTYLSDFGPAGATGGVWECPDLFPLPVDGDPANTKWVLAVGLNPGSVAGGSGVQYFLGRWDGTRFAPDEPTTYSPPPGTVFADFEGSDYGAWATTGTAFGSGPAQGTLPGQQPVSGYLGHGLVNSFLGGDGPTGTLTSPTFTVTQPYLNFLVGGGNHPMSAPAPTAVNLVVDGTVVRTATGSDSEALDWTSWDLHDLVGKSAQLQVVDQNSGGWGHINADEFMFADAPALSSIQRAHWVDNGSDFYASSTYNDAPDGRRIMVGWMNNWNYGTLIPTSPWRGADSFPRQLGLRTVDGTVRLTARPVDELQTLRSGPAVRMSGQSVSGTVPLALTGNTLDITADLDAGTASRFGLNVLSGPGQQTQIGYDTSTQQLYVDRTASGDVSFAPSFPNVQRVSLPLTQGALRLRVLVDASSVEVFGDQGQAVLTSQVFPGAGSVGVSAFAEGGTAQLADFTGWHLNSSWR